MSLQRMRYPGQCPVCLVDYPASAVMDYRGPGTKPSHRSCTPHPSVVAEDTARMIANDAALTARLAAQQPVSRWQPYQGKEIRIRTASGREMVGNVLRSEGRDLLTFGKFRAWPHELRDTDTVIEEVTYG